MIATLMTPLSAPSRADQVQRRLRGAIRSGVLEAGTQLPSEKELAERLGKPLLGKVPLLPGLREGSDTGMPIVVSSPGSEAAVAFDEIARRIVEELAPTKRFHPELKVN